MEEALGYIVLSDEDYAKGRFLLQGAITDIMNPLRMYGQDEYVTQAIIWLTSLGEDFAQYTRGNLDKPISSKYVQRWGK